MIIQNKENLKLAYVCLSLYKELNVDAFKIIKLKKQIRTYGKSPHTKHIVKDYGIDGYIELVTFPGFLDTSDKEEAEDWFKEYHVQGPIHSSYDCTGRPFTIWFKVIRRQGHWAAYHSVGFDV